MAYQHHGGVELRNQAAPVRDPFAWREALSPAISPVSTARNSRAGSVTPPRSVTPPLRANTPPLSPAVTSRSGMSSGSRSNGSVRNYETPEPSARSSDFVSVYDQTSARTVVDIGTLYEEEQMQGGPISYPIGYPGFEDAARPRSSAGNPRRQRAAAAALDAFAPQGDGVASGAMPPAPEVSLDPRQVFSSARHGRHKEVEAALIEGFDPYSGDQFGNTLFHVACQNGNKRIAKMAIKYGGDMDCQNIKGHTGLHFLFAYGYPDIAEYFMEKGANDQILNEVGKTAREGIR